MDLKAQDHSRVCGKNWSSGAGCHGRLGSLPRVREKLTLSCPMTVPSGITPACAGKTILFTDKASLLQDHSRVCGKNGAKNLTGMKTVGSLPRVREKHYYCFEFIFCHRITPACAGKTLECYHVCLQHWDHSRVCGKNKKFGQLYRTWLGSLPRVREKQ